MAKMKMAVCAYCGEYALTEREHVVPETYAPEELRKACKWGVRPLNPVFPGGSARPAALGTAG
jgi:hypothetical protein